MSGLGKRRPPRARSGTSGLTRQSPAKASSGRESGGAYATDPTPATPAELRIESLAHDGRGIARTAAGKTVFVEGALPGEVVQVAVHRTRKRYDEAHLRSVITASPLRVRPPCPYIDRCGGCDLQHLGRQAQREHKAAVLGELLGRHGDEIPSIEIIATEAQAYRRRARLGVRLDGEGRVQLGFRARRSHRLVSVSSCTVLVPALAALLPGLHQLVASLEAPRQVGHLELLETEQGSTVVIRQLRPHPGDLARWRDWAQRNGVFLAMWQGRPASIFEWVEPQGGPAALTVNVPGPRGELRLALAPGDFLQANDGVNRRMVHTALDWLGDASERQRLLDLFAGIGNFSVPLAAAGYDVVAVEGQPAMVEKLRHNADQVGGPPSLEARQANLHDDTQVRRLLEQGRADVVVLDPPREGAEAICRELAQRPVARVLYIACDPATLARDAAYLLQGGYRLTCAAMADMFVHTSHLESMLLFEYREPQSPRQGVASDG